MEEKERYEQYGYETIIDNEVDSEDYEHSRLYMSDVVNLLNRQDKEIKQIKEENKELKNNIKLYVADELCEVLYRFRNKDIFLEDYLIREMKELRGEENENR